MKNIPAMQSITAHENSFIDCGYFSTTHLLFSMNGKCVVFVNVRRISLSVSAHKLQDDMELDWLQQAEVLHYRLEHGHSNAVPQLTHNPWSIKCHQQHLQRMKENAKHRNQYSILLRTEN